MNDRPTPARKHTPVKMLGRFGDLVALGLSRRQIDDTVASGELRILKRSLKQGNRCFDMMDAYRLMGYCGVHGLIPEAHLAPSITKRIGQALRNVLPAVPRSSSFQQLRQLEDCIGEGGHLVMHVVAFHHNPLSAGQLHLNLRNHTGIVLRAVEEWRSEWIDSLANRVDLPWTYCGTGRGSPAP